MKLKPLLQGAGLATLYIFPFAADFLTPSLGDAYHRLHPLTTIYRAIFLLAIGLWIVAALAFWRLEQYAGKWKRLFWLVPSVLLFWLLARDCATAFQHWPRIALFCIHAGHFVVPGVIMLGLSLLLLRPTLFDSGVAGIRVVYIVAGFGLLAILPQIGRHALHSGPHEQSGFVETALPAANPSSPRIVWVLMDELSYDQVFDHRVQDVELPNFDRLAHSSLRFSAVKPFADFTEEILPGLLLGKPIKTLMKPVAGPPRYRSNPDGPWQEFNQYQTIFADARSLGWSTGVAGWYNPYCRLLPDVLNRCFWQYSEPGNFDLASSLSSTNSLTQNIFTMMPLRSRLLALIHKPVAPGNQAHRDDYVTVMAQAKALLQDSSIRFAFIHLPVPHPSGIYDRYSHTLSDHGSYLDNLVLADQALGELQNSIGSTSAAANTTLIVSSDHSWRTFWWRETGNWSEAEQKASRGQFDPRPVLIVRFPGHHPGQVVSNPVNVLFVHRILEGLLNGEIQNPADIDRLLDRPLPRSIALRPGKATEVQTGN